MQSTDVCLISSGLPSSNPRLLKEAAILSAHGFHVHCIVADYATPLRRYDEELLRRSCATFTRVGLGTTAIYRAKRLRNLLARQSMRWLSWSDQIAAWATSTIADDLARTAASVPASIYIGHTLPALPAAVHAAEKRGVIAGFDAEDFHPGETGRLSADSVAHGVCRRFLHRCKYLTAASPLIADEFRRRYGTAMTPVLNAFPCSPFRRIRHEMPLRLYWFSQTVGPGRGLEALLRGAGLSRCPVVVSVRGIVQPAYRQHLQELARNASVGLECLPPANPDDMVTLAAEHHVGLSLEQSTPLNRSLCLTNKVFTYLAAGRPQILSATSAQLGVAADLGEAGSVVDLDIPETIGRAIDSFGDREVWIAGCERARQIQECRYSWELESVKVVSGVRDVLGVPAI